MKPDLKTLATLVVFGFTAYAAYADTVTISTYYPSPYASYQTLETNTLQGASGTGNVAMVPTGGNVGIRNGTGAAPASLLDIGNNTLASSAIINVNAAANQQTGINFQSAGANSWSMYRPASSTELRFWDGSADRVRIAAGGNVGIGLNPVDTPDYRLDVQGTANFRSALRLQTNTTETPGSNELQVDCDTGVCYAIAVYA